MSVQSDFVSHALSTASIALYSLGHKGIVMSAALPALLRPTLPHCGLVREMPIETYCAVDALSYGGAKLFARSPFHHFACMVDERRPPKRELGGQLEGSLAHCLILEPGEYPFRYAVGPDVRTRAAPEWKEFVARHPNHICIKPEQEATARAQAASVRALPDVAKLLARGEAEVSAFWRDPVTGVDCKGRPDWVHPVDTRGVILLDVKTYSDASPREFARQVARKLYHWQAAWYTDGYSLAAQTPVIGFVFVAVEVDYPYAACAVMLDEDSLALARRELAPIVERYAECRRTHSWPGYPVGIEQIELPAWYRELSWD